MSFAQKTHAIKLLGVFDHGAWFVYGLCMATKTISIETDAYDLLAQEKKDRTESFSRVIRRLFAERPALTAGDLLDVMQEFRGKGAGPRRKRR
jgi:predicted CopG family antitoxin